MRGVWVAVWLAGAGAAVADPFCAPGVAELATLPGLVAGTWQGVIAQGVVVQAGKPSALPQGSADTAVFSAVPGGISFSDATTADGIVLMPGAAGPVPDFALPGESPMAADELLGPLLAEAGIACAPNDLPRFQGGQPMPGGMAATFQAYLLSQHQMLMVMQVGQAGPVVDQKADGVRVVLSYTR